MPKLNFLALLFWFTTCFSGSPHANLKFLVLAFKNLGSSKTACLVLSFFFLHLSLCQWYQPSTIHLFTPPTNKHLLLPCCPNLCTDFLNSASCCDAHRQNAKLKRLDWEVTSYSWQVFLYQNKIQNKTIRKKRTAQHFLMVELSWLLLPQHQEANIGLQRY